MVVVEVVDIIRVEKEILEEEAVVVVEVVVVVVVEALEIVAVEADCSNSQCSTCVL